MTNDIYKLALDLKFLLLETRNYNYQIRNSTMLYEPKISIHKLNKSLTILDRLILLINNDINNYKKLEQLYDDLKEEMDSINS